MAILLVPFLKGPMLENAAGVKNLFLVMHLVLSFLCLKDEEILTIKIGRRWLGQSLIIRLNAGGRFIGKIHSFRVKARLPRLVFLADQSGVYTARNGLDNPVRILKFTGDRKRHVNRVLNFLPIQTNLNWRPVDYVEEFAVMGGPFNMNGYSWRAPVKVSGPGLFRKDNIGVKL